MDTPPPKKQCLAQLSPVDYSSDTVSDQCYITALPSELLVAIFAYLSSRDKVRLCALDLSAFSLISK